MAILCPACGRQYDPTLFEFGRSVRCDCGYLITEMSHVITMQRKKEGYGWEESNQEKPAEKEEDEEK